MAQTDHEAPKYTVGDQYHSGLTVSGLFSLWLTSIQDQVSPASFRNYKRLAERHILPTIGTLEVDYLTEADINDFLKDKLQHGRLDGKGGLSMKTVSDLSSLLRSALKLVSWDYSFTSSAHSFVESQHVKREISVLTMPQAETLTKYLTQNFNRSNAGFLLCLFTGIRLSEICSLKDSDFILSRDCVQIRRTLQRVTMSEASAGETEFPTVDYGPADSGYRSLILPPRLSMLLWSLLRQSKGNAYFLTGLEDASIGPRAYQYRFQKVLDCCGLPASVNFHMLRHTFALLWLLRCNDLEGLSLALGHSSVKATRNRYSKIIETADAMLPKCSKYLCVSAAPAEEP